MGNRVRSVRNETARKFDLHSVPGCGGKRRGGAATRPRACEYLSTAVGGNIRGKNFVRASAFAGLSSVGARFPN